MRAESSSAGLGESADVPHEPVKDGGSSAAKLLTAWSHLGTRLLMASILIITRRIVAVPAIDSAK